MVRFSRATRINVVRALLVFFSLIAGTQAQQDSSLADLARQTRAQKLEQPQSESNRAQQAVSEISEDQNDNGAPGGFKTYSAGDYKVWVPYPYHVDGHDDAGVVLSGPQVGSKHAIVLVGTPFVAHWKNNDAAFQDAAIQFTRVYAQSVNCTKATVANQSAYHCGLAAATLLGQQVSGNAVFVQSEGNIYPVLCVTPSSSWARDAANNPRSSSRTKQWAGESMAREDDDARKVWQNCETVFQSIHIEPGGAKLQQRTNASNQSPNEGTKQAIEALKANAAVHPAAPVQAPAPTAENTTPAGYKVQAFNYCQSATHCWDASVLVPSEAKLISSNCKQYAFEMKVQGSPFLLLTGVAGAACDGGDPNDSSQVRWKQLVDPESKRAPGTSSTISTESAKIDGKPATITTLGFRKGLESWMGKRADVESNGSQIVVGCLALRDHFADGDAVCSALIESLRLP